MADFGLARDTDGQSKLSTRTIAGTRRYLSPELEDNIIQSIKSDIWAFGVVLLELAYGRDIYKDSAITRMDSYRIRIEFEEKGGYSKEMIEFLSKCFELENEDRPTVTNLLRDKWFADFHINTSKPVIKLQGMQNIPSSQPSSVIKSGNFN